MSHLFGFLPLKRQHFVNEQFCDILALANNNQLVVLELKNNEDRYVVQQLTRCYHALLQEKPFQDQVDYSKPIRLIAIAPSFHRDNLIDRKYSLLAVKFLAFDILHEQSKFNWRLQDADSRQVWHLNIPYQASEMSHTLPPVPRKLINRLSDVEEARRERILQIRQKILSFDKRMKETSLSSSIVYGKGKTALCAELKFGSLSGSRSKSNLFLWLPHLTRKCIGRMLIWNTESLRKLERMGYYPNNRRYDFQGESPHLMVKALQEWEYFQDSYGARKYAKLIQNPDRLDDLELFIEIALENWIERI
ncbi:endonuclease NucS domain-containing protein [Leptolyngbya sp. FACHB-17]|uniref:endonuclease NucS domain-containing protein n=1 Tax=unclassified Leptolyngbya TaxID=2650499 RepID=UPI001681908A|nr:endonuclease NucS domain-containing protein [Leptolyngbya sp. FACHB-17]MBD2082084.1 DUF91 domain-containing protein [Leptolyngbya sp. FACHB-17]